MNPIDGSPIDYELERRDELDGFDLEYLKSEQDDTYGC